MLGLYRHPEPHGQRPAHRAAILEVATDLERMADYAKGNSRVSLMIGPQPLISPLPELDEMTSLGCSLLRRSLDAFVAHDADAAAEIPAEDDRVDQLYNQVYSRLIQMIIDNPDKVDEATNLLWVAHNLERFSDRVTNICERVVFTVTGEFLELDVEDEDLPDMAEGDD